jgi:hypothetical protein
MKYPHWQYYKSIIGDIEVVSRYVEISTDNYSTYSIELTRLLLSAGSEIDVVAKLLCKLADPEAAPDNINKYREILTHKFPGLPEVEVAIPKYLISFKPWLDWLENKTPKWWDCYNKVKHERSQHFREADLENVLLATAGLCVLVSYLYYDDLNKLIGFTSLFMLLDRKYYKREKGKVLVKEPFALPDFEQKTGVNIKQERKPSRTGGGS